MSSVYVVGEARREGEVAEKAKRRPESEEQYREWLRKDGERLHKRRADALRHAQ